MKHYTRGNRKLAVAMALLLFVSLFAMPAGAETVLKDGIEVTLTTDKESYDALETIGAKLTVKNTNSFSVDNVSMEIAAPEGYVIDGGSETHLGALDAGEAQQQQTSLRDAEAPAPILPKTGDDTHALLWAALFVVAAGALCALTVKSRQAKRVIALILCAALVGPYAAEIAPAIAENEPATGMVIVSKEVLVNGEAVLLTGVVTYAEIKETNAEPDANTSVFGLKINETANAVKVKAGDKLAFTGTISAAEGNALSSVQVFVYDATTEIPYTMGEKYYAIDGLNQAQFDLASVPEMTIGEAFGESEYALIEGGSYVVMFYAMDSEGNRFADMDTIADGNQGPMISVRVLMPPEKCTHAAKEYTYERDDAVAARVTDNEDGLTHLVEESYERYCADCGAYLMNIWGSGTNADHTIVNGLCTGCGYAPIMLMQEIPSIEFTSPQNGTEYSILHNSDEEDDYLVVTWNEYSESTEYVVYVKVLDGEPEEGSEEENGDLIVSTENCKNPYYIIKIPQKVKDKWIKINVHGKNGEVQTEAASSLYVYIGTREKEDEECSHSYSYDVIGTDYYYVENDYDDHYLGYEWEYVCSWCGDTYTKIELQKYSYEMHKFDSNTSTCTVCNCQLPKLTVDIEQHVIDDGVKLDISVNGNGGRVREVLIKVEEPRWGTKVLFDWTGATATSAGPFEAKFSSEFSSINPGEYKLYVWAKDQVGNEHNLDSADGNVFVYTFNVSEPEGKAVFTSHLNGDVVNVGEEVKIEWECLSSYYMYCCDIKILADEPAYTDNENGEVWITSSQLGLSGIGRIIPTHAEGKWLCIRVYATNGNGEVKVTPTNLYLKVAGKQDCQHTQYTDYYNETYPIQYTQKDATSHYYQLGYDRICNACSESWQVYADLSEENVAPHDYTNGDKCPCGYDRSNCQHTTGDVKTYKRHVFAPFDEKQHQTIAIVWDMVCSSCGLTYEMTDTEGDAENPIGLKYKHEWENGKCKTQGCEYECAHPEKDKEGEENYKDEYLNTISLKDNKDGKTHLHTYNVKRTCLTCGHSWTEKLENVPEEHTIRDLDDKATYDFDSEEHWLVVPKGCSCNYLTGITVEKEREIHYQYQFIKPELKYYPAEHQHFVRERHAAYCICGETVTDYLYDIGWEDHKYENNVCKCGKIKNQGATNTDSDGNEIDRDYWEDIQETDQDNYQRERVEELTDYILNDSTNSTNILKSDFENGRIGKEVAGYVYDVVTDVVSLDLKGLIMHVYDDVTKDYQNDAAKAILATMASVYSENNYSETLDGLAKALSYIREASDKTIGTIEGWEDIPGSKIEWEDETKGIFGAINDIEKGLKLTEKTLKRCADLEQEKQIAIVLLTSNYSDTKAELEQNMRIAELSGEKELQEIYERALEELDGYYDNLVNHYIDNPFEIMGLDLILEGVDTAIKAATKDTDYATSAIMKKLGAGKGVLFVHDVTKTIMGEYLGGNQMYDSQEEILEDIIIVKAMETDVEISLKRYQSHNSDIRQKELVKKLITLATYKKIMIEDYMEYDDSLWFDNTNESFERDINVLDNYIKELNSYLNE